MPSTQFWSESSLSIGTPFDPFVGNDYIIGSAQNWIAPRGVHVPNGEDLYVVLIWYVYSYFVLNNDIRVDSFNVNLFKVVGLDEITLSEVSICPNPANSNHNLSFQNQAAKEVIVFDLLGNKIATFDASESMTISTDEFLNGSYFLSWKIEEMNYNQKFQVQH